MLAIDLRAQNKNKMLEEYFFYIERNFRIWCIKNEDYYTNSFSPRLGNSLVSKSYMNYFF